MKFSSQIFLAVIVLYSVVFSGLLPNVLKAQEQTHKTTVRPKNLSTIPQATGSAGQNNGYVLPYPGMLPDHPLYPLKRFRDRLLNYLIKDPVKQVEYHLLMADKRYAMSLSLAKKGNYQLSFDTVWEAEQYFADIVDEINRAKRMGKVLSASQYAALELAGNMHKEVVLQVSEQSPEEYLKGYEKIIDEIDRNLKSIRDTRE